MIDRRTVAITVCALMLIGLIRAIVLYGPGSPAGIDGGNWLAFGSFPRRGLVYPPAIPMLFTGLAWLVGPVMATAVAGAIATVAPGLAVFAAVAWARHPIVGALAAVVITGSSAIGEVAAWGGYPQPLATALAVVALVAASDWLSSGGRRSLAVFVTCVSGVITTSHLVAVPCLAALAGTCALWCLLRPATAHRVPAVVIGALAPLVVLLPTYAALFATLGQPGTDQAGDLGRVLGTAWPAYFAVLLAAPLALVVARRSTLSLAGEASADEVLLVAGSTSGITWVSAYVLTSEPRLLYDIEVLAVLTGALIVITIAASLTSVAVRRISSLAIIVAAAGFVGMGLAAFPSQVSLYRVLTPDRFEAMQWLAAQPAKDSDAIVVGDVGGVPIGWWAEGLARQETRYASDLRWLRFPSERERAISANLFLYRSGFPSPDSASMAADAGVAYVYLPSAGAFGVDPSNPPPGWSVAFSSGDAIILTPSPTTSGRPNALP